MAITRIFRYPEMPDCGIEDILDECERAIKLGCHNSKFRDDITHSIGLCWHAEQVCPDEVSQYVFVTVPRAAISKNPGGDACKVIVSIQDVMRQAGIHPFEGRAPFAQLVRGLAIAFYRATGRVPSVSFNESYRRFYGAFWRLVETILPVASAMAAQAGMAFRIPATESARVKSIKRTLKDKDMVAFFKSEQSLRSMRLD
jgi:hypothetical protein